MVPRFSLEKMFLLCCTLPPNRMDLGNMKPIPKHGKTSAIWTIAFLAWPFRVIPWAGPSAFWCGLFWSLLRLDHHHFRVAFFSHSLSWTSAIFTFFCVIPLAGPLPFRGGVSGSLLRLDHRHFGVAFFGYSLGWTMGFLAWIFRVTP